jgi:hypothetical protein
MNIERLIEVMHATPFMPFSLLLPNGDKMHIPHADFIWVHPDRRTIIAVDASGKTRILNHQMLVGIELEGSVA